MASGYGTGIIIMKPLAGGAFKNVELALQFILEHAVSTVIPGMDSLQQVEENVRIGTKSESLSPAERNMIQKEAAELGSSFCRRCEYCQPCPQGINVPLVFLLDGYYTRYGLTDWAQTRYQSMKIKPTVCTECKECEEKCPYNLPINQMLVEARTRLEQSGK